MHLRRRLGGSIGCPCSKLLQRMPRLPSLQEDVHLHNKLADLHVDSWNNTWDPAKEINYGPYNVRCLSFRRLGRLKPESPSPPTLAFPICHAETTLTHKPPSPGIETQRRFTQWTSQILTCWWFQPLWKICSSKWVHLPQFYGWKFQKIFQTTNQIYHGLV